MLRSLLERKSEVAEVRAQATTWGTWPGDSGTSTGADVSQTTAMQLLAVSGCVRLITDSIATLPTDVFRESQQTGIRTEVTKPYWLKSPTIDLDFTAWCTQVLTSLLLHGNAYIHVTRNANAGILELYPMDPATVTVRRVNGRKEFFVNGTRFMGEIRHIVGMMLPGSDVGLSPLEYARQSISGGLSAQQYANDNFDQGLNMPGVIESPGVMQPDQMTAIANAWRRARSKRNRGLPGVLQGGAVWKPTGVTNEQAQFLESRQWTAAEISGQVYMVDPSDLGIPVSGTSLTYTNLEQRNIRRLQVTLLPWIIRVEAMLSALLPQPQFMKFNTDGLLRADSAARWTTYEAASRINTALIPLGQPPVLTTTEMRDFEDLGVVEEYPAPEVAPPEPQTLSSPTVYETHIHMPEEREQVPSVVNVTVPELRSPDVHVHNEPAAVVVDVQPTTVHVPAGEVRVISEAVEPRQTVRRVVRDADGRIERVIDEVV